jgi:hypothetical protein
MVLARLSRPLRAIEYVIPITIIASTIVSIAESFLGSPTTQVAFLAALIDEFQVVSIVFAALSVFAIVHLFTLHVADSFRSLNIRQNCLFAYVVGLSFVGFLSLSFQGILGILWVNMLALSTVSTILYLNLRVMLNER